MAYHITLVTNKSNSSIAITNPAYEADSKLVANGAAYVPKRPILVNKIPGNPSYADALTQAVNIYTSTDNYCFWDNTNSSVNGVGQKGGAIPAFNMSAGNLQITINPNGTLTFS
ncbi:MAG: hypothetical protein ABI822_32545, partial [Bryobacteraceae bacterium]